MIRSPERPSAARRSPAHWTALDTPVSQGLEGSDVGAVIEFNHALITDPHTFFMTGYWRPPPPEILSWTEVEP